MVSAYQHFEILFSALGAAEESPEGQAATFLVVGVAQQPPEYRVYLEGRR